MTNLELSRTVLRRAAGHLEVSIPALENAADITELNFEGVRKAALDKLAELRKEMKTGPKEPIDIVACGSMARGEMSETESDFDYLLVAYGRITNPDEIRKVRQAAEHARVELQVGRPGAFGAFGSLVSALDVVNLIGLESDTNRNHTNRILLLEESRSLLQPQGREDLLKAVLDRYLYDYIRGPDGVERPKEGVPRFLLNDVARYWRTIAVDYQGKRWEELEGAKWGMRYLKLRSTRKLVYAGTLISLFLPRILGQAVSSTFLRDQFNLSPLARLVQLETHIKDSDLRKTLKNILVLAEYFCEKFASKEFRDRCGGVAIPTDDENNPAEFREARDQTMALQKALEELFGSPAPFADAPPVAKSPLDLLTMAHLRDRYLLF